MINWKPAPPGPYYLSTMAAPVGPLWAIHAADMIVAAEFDGPLPTRYGSHVLSHTAPPEWLQQLFDWAFSGRPTGAWSAVDPGLTSLERALLSTASDIPFGTTASYGTVAAWAGFPRRARAAGRAMSRSPIAYLIPTHRVIRADGRPANCQHDPVNQALRAFERIDLGPPGGMIGGTR